MKLIIFLKYKASANEITVSIQFDMKILFDSVLIAAQTNTIFGKFEDQEPMDWS